MGLAALAAPQFWPATVTGSAKGGAPNARVFSATGTNRNGSMRYLMLFNRATVLAGGEVPLVAWPIPPASGGIPGVDAFGDIFTVDGILFPLGLVWGMSTTSGSYTAATAADHDVTIVANP